jgi:hypothetical protein
MIFVKQRNIIEPSPILIRSIEVEDSACRRLLAGFLLGLLFGPDEAGLSDYRPLRPMRQYYAVFYFAVVFLQNCSQITAAWRRWEMGIQVRSFTTNPRTLSVRASEVLKEFLDGHKVVAVITNSENGGWKDLNLVQAVSYSQHTHLYSSVQTHKLAVLRHVNLPAHTWANPNLFKYTFSTRQRIKLTFFIRKLLQSPS